MSEFYNNYMRRNTWFHILTTIAIILLFASFALPPTGVIDPSVLAAIGELFAFASLGAVIKAIDKGTSAKIHHHDTDIEFSQNDEE